MTIKGKNRRLQAQ